MGRTIDQVPRRLALIAALLVVGCSSNHTSNPTASSAPPATTTTRPATTTTAAFVPQPADFSPCGGRVQCATVTVPLDYADPTGQTIEVAINKLPARHPDERIGVLLMNPGGPGGSGLGFVSSGTQLGSGVLDHFDVIGFDPRGVGRSTRLTCASSQLATYQQLDSAPDTPDEQAALDTAAKAVADDCGQAAGNLLTHVGTDDVVRDMDTIRQALGETQLNYLGISYGTLLGLRYAQLFPHNARAITIDGVVDPSQPFTVYLRQQAVAFDHEIERMLAAGGVTEEYDQLAQEVESAPVPGNNGRSLGPSQLAVAALIPTYETAAQPAFYRAVSSALQGDASTMLQIADSYYDSVEFPLYMAVECTDSPHPVGAAAYEQFAQDLEGVSPRVGGAIANELLPCAFWPAPVKDITGPVVAPDAPPILVIGNTDDAATPYEQAVNVAKTLARGRLLTFESAGHAAYGLSDCVTAAEDAYFVDLTLPGEGATCSK